MSGNSYNPNRLIYLPIYRQKYFYSLQTYILNIEIVEVAFRVKSKSHEIITANIILIFLFPITINYCNVTVGC